MAEPRDVADEFERHVMLLFKATAGDGFTEDDFQAQVGEFAQFAMDNRGPILSALRSPGLDRDGERMRERCARACDARALGCKTAAQEWAEGSVNFPPQPEIAHAFITAADQCRQLAETVRTLPLAHEEKAGC